MFKRTNECQNVLKGLKSNDIVEIDIKITSFFYSMYSFPYISWGDNACYIGLDDEKSTMRINKDGGVY